MHRHTKQEHDERRDGAVTIKSDSAIKDKAGRSGRMCL